VRGKGCHAEKSADIQGSTALHPWSWQPSEFLQAGAAAAPADVGGAAAALQRTALAEPLDWHPRRHYRPEQFAETTGSSAARAPYSQHEGPGEPPRHAVVAAADAPRRGVRAAEGVRSRLCPC